jgi:hypothetical protein
MESTPKTAVIPGIVRWTARIAGTLAAALVLLFVSASILGDQSEGGPPGLQPGLIFGCWILGVLLAWKWEGIGGVLLVLSSVVFLFVTPSALWPPTPLTAFPISGILFLAYWFGRRRAG